MKWFCAIVLFGLALAASPAEDKKAKAEKATVQVTGEFTADKDTTVGYTLKKGAKVIAEEKGVAAFPGKVIDIDAADAAGPFELRVAGTGGVVKVKQIGVTVVADGKTSKGTFGTAPWSLNAPDPSGGVVRAMTVPITPVAVKTEEPKKIEEPKKTEEPKKVEEPKKKTEEPKKTVEEPKKKVEEPKKTVEEKKVEDAGSLPTAPTPKVK